MMSKINEGENEPLRRNEKIAEAPELSKFQQLMPQVGSTTPFYYVRSLHVSFVSLNPIFGADRSVIMRCFVLLLHWPNSRVFRTRCSIDPRK